MCVHDNNGARSSRDEGLVRMLRISIRKRILRLAAPAMRSRDDSQRAVFSREIIQHPDAVANGKSFFVWEQSHIDVERLQAGRFGIRRSHVQAAQFESTAKDALNEFENLAPLNRLAKNV